MGGEREETGSDTSMAPNELKHKHNNPSHESSTHTINSCTRGERVCKPPTRPGAESGRAYVASRVDHGE